MSETIFILDGASYLHFKNLNFSNSQRIMDVREGSHHVELSECRLNYGSYGLVVREDIHDFEIHHCEFNNGLPDYVYWTDVKNESEEVAEAYPEFQSVAIIGSIPGFNIHHNTFRNGFDAFNIKDGSHEITITENVFRNLRDDAIELQKGVSNVEIARNMFWHVGAGISNISSDRQAGHVYIHHNVIDNSAYQRGGRPGNYREENWPVWTVIDPFASHDDGDKRSWWKLYNNTIVTRKGGYQWNDSGPSPVRGNSEKYVYNNIFYIIDDRIVFRDEQASQGSHYDGNIIYRNAPGDLPLFLNFGDGDDYWSLADFKQNSGTQWEVNGLEIDPDFNICTFDDPLFDPSMMWERYRPKNDAVFTPGASYDGLDWPGAAGVNYRGAISPLTSQSSTTFKIFLPVTISSLQIC
jgi:hypothetical protein